MTTRFALLAIALVFAAPLSGVSGQTHTALPDSSELPFRWSEYAPSTTVAGFTVQQYLHPDGAPGGTVIPVEMPVIDRGSAQPASAIGALRWQFAPFAASTAGPRGAANEVGTALMGGFQPYDLGRYPGVDYSFLQVFTDATSGGIDGGGAYGKVNQDIPDWGANPGWNFEGDHTPFDYFDIPFDSIFRDPETVTLETALVAHDRHKVLILDDLTWGFTANEHGAGSLIASPPMEQPGGASARLLSFYRHRFRDVTYFNEGETSLSQIPEPPGQGILLAGLAIGHFLVFGRSRTSNSDRAPG